MSHLKITVYRDTDLIDKDKSSIAKTLMNQGFGSAAQCLEEAQRRVKKVEYTQVLNSTGRIDRPEELVCDIVKGRKASFSI